MPIGIKDYVIIGLAGALLAGGVTGGVVALKQQITVANLKLEKETADRRADAQEKRANLEKKRADANEKALGIAKTANQSLIDQNVALAASDRKTDVRYIERGRVIEKVVRERDLTTANWIIDSVNTGFYDQNSAAPPVITPPVQK